MPRIPVYQSSARLPGFGAQPRVDVGVFTQQGQDLARAGAALADIGGQVGQELAAEREREAERQQRLADATYITEQSSAFTRDMTAEFDRRRREGDPTAPDFTDEFMSFADGRIADAQGAGHEGISDEAAVDLNGRLQNMRTSFFDSALRVQAAAREARAGTAFEQGVNELAAAVMRDPAYLDRAVAGVDGLIAEFRGALAPDQLANARSSARAALLGAQVRGALDVGAIDVARDALRRTEFDIDLTPSTRETLANAIEVAEAREAARAEAERREALARLADDIGAAEDVLLAGYEPPNLALLTARAAGTELADDLAAIASNARLARTFALLAPAEQRRQLAALGAGAVKTRDEVVRLQLLARVNATTEKALTDDPLGHAARLGLIDEPVALDFEDPASLAFRAGQAVVASEHFGVPVAPLTKAETASLAGALDGLDADGATALLASLVQGFGPEATDLIADELADGRPAFAVAASYAATNPELARAIVAGDRLYKATEEVRPGKVDVQAAIEEAWGDAFEGAPAALATYRDAALALYAARRVPGGDLTLDNDVLVDAFRDAAGRPVRLNGRDTIPPIPFMDEDAFEAAVESVTAEELAAFGNGPPAYADGTTFDAADLADAELVAVGPGRYLVLIDGLGYLAGAGGAYVLDLKAVLDARAHGNTASTKLTAAEQRIVDYHKNSIATGNVGRDEQGRPITVFSVGPRISSGPYKGMYASVPGWVNGRRLTEDQALAHWKDEIDQGLWPVYRTGAELNRRSREIHELIERDAMRRGLTQ